MKDHLPIPRVVCALLFLSLALTTLPRLLSLTREAATLFPLSYEARRERQMGHWFTSIQSLRRNLSKNEPVALVLGLRDTEAGIFANYYLYPIRTRLFAGRDDYRNAAPDPTRPKTIVAVTSDRVERAAYDVLRDRELRAGRRVVAAPLLSEPATSFVLPIAASVDGPAPETFVVEATIRNESVIDAEVRVTFAPNGRIVTLKIAHGATLAYYDFVYQLFATMQTGWIRVESSQPLRAAFYLANRGRGDATLLPNVTGIATTLPSGPLFRDSKLFLLNSASIPALAVVDNEPIPLPPYVLVSRPITKVPLVKGNVYAFVTTREAECQDRFSLAHTMIGLVITIALFPLAGWSIARRSWGEAFLWGVGLVGAILFLAGIAHVPLLVALAGIVFGAIALLFATRRSSDNRRPVSYPPLATIVMMIPLLILAVISAVVPLTDFDGRAFWVLKAKGITHERAIDGPFFNGATLDPRNHYPILIPLDGAVIMGLAHDLDDRQVRWIYVGLLAALALLVRERIGQLVSPAAGAWCAALLVWTPQFAVATEGGALSAYNDIAIAGFAAGAFFELVAEVAQPRDRATSQPRDLAPLRFGLWLAFLVLTKSEGLPFALVFLMIGAFVFRKRIITPAIVAALAAVALLIWRARIPAGDEEDIVRMLPTIPEKLHHLRAALTAFPQHMLDFPSWGLFWIAVVIAGVLAVRVDRRAATLAIALIASMLAVYCAVYVATDWIVADLIAVTANRLLIHLVAPSLLLIALAAQRWTRTKSI